jgi:hypothetical protein
MKMKKLCILSTVLLLLSGIGCSYVMDSVEGAITKRSSFGVDVTKGAGLTFNWSKDAPSIDAGAFAGYEIYITSERNNEFSGYQLFAGNSLNPGAASVGEQTQLDNPATQSVTISSYTLPNGPGTYFFRVGVIYWDEKDPNKRNSDWTIPPFASNKSYYYITTKQTDIEKISGGTMVTF